ncbi:MAG: hypothetical protein MOGMAGMI_00807 [Candidatus Omnitrophica bacterium]|nr:hypothetical protein [Candidatus Omnitrophota bacterium]
MKFWLKDFKDDNQSVRISEDIDPKALDLDTTVMQFPDVIALDAEAWRAGDELTVQTHLEGERRFTCSKCNEPFNNVFEKDFTLHYDIKGLDSISIEQDVRDELLLELPIRVLCRPDCRGLCDRCGANLNNGPCACAGTGSQQPK